MSEFTFAGTYGPQQVIDVGGHPLEDLSLSVFVHGTTNLAALYTDRTKATGAANPMTTDSLGNLTFFADPGQYDIAGNGATITVTVYADPAEPLKGDLTGILPGPMTLANTSNVAAIVAADGGGGGGGGGAISSVFARTGAITAETGDYSVGQITGAAPLASPAFTGIPTVPAPAAGNSTLQIATTAFVTALATNPVGGFVFVQGLTNDAGASDQTAVVTAAENMLPANGGWLVFPAFDIGIRQWVPKTGTNIMGSGSGTQGTDGATTFMLPTSGDTTSLFVINFANNMNVMMNADVDGGSRGAQDANGVGYATPLLITGQDQTIVNSHMEGGHMAALQTITNGVGRTRLFNVITEGLGGSGLVRTIAGTCTITNNSNVLQDSAGSFTAADIGRGISANPANTAGIPLGTRLVPFATIRSGTAGTVGAIVTAGTINLSNNNHILTGGTNSISVMTSGGPITFTYTGLTGSGATTQLTGVTSSASGAQLAYTVVAGANTTNTTQIKIDQAATVTVSGTATVGLIQNYTVIIGSTDTQCTECRFVQGTSVIGNETNSSATQHTQVHFTNTLTSVENAGGVLFEGSSNQWGCYYDTCPPNGSNVVHKQGVKQVQISSGYTFNNQASNPVWYTENDNATGITIRGLVMAPPNGTWSAFVRLAGGPNSSIVINGVHAVDNTAFSGTTLASLFTGVGIPTAKPFGCGSIRDIVVNGVQLDTRFNPVAVSANYTAASFDSIYATSGSGGITITLPSSPILGEPIRIKKVDSGAGAVTISGTVDGVTNPTLLVQYDQMWLEWTGSAWANFSALTGNTNFINLVEAIPAQNLTPTAAWDLNGQLVHNFAQSGWVSDKTVWTRTSNTTFTVPGNVTSTYVAGVILSWKESGTQKYGVVVSSAFTTLTTVTLVSTADYVMAASPDSNTNMYAQSWLGIPYDFPSSFTWTGIGQTGLSGTVAVGGRFSIKPGRKIRLDFAAGATNSNAITFTITGLPITSSPTCSVNVPVQGEDNGSLKLGILASIGNSVTAITLGIFTILGVSGNSWTNAATAKGAQGQIEYDF